MRTGWIWGRGSVCCYPTLDLRPLLCFACSAPSQGLPPPAPVQMGWPVEDIVCSEVAGDFRKAP